MKNKGTAIALVLVAVIAAGAYTQQYDSEDDFWIERKGSKITITGYRGTKTEVRIPARIQNLPVTGIAKDAFTDCTGITGVIIPDSVKSIGQNAFADCTDLTSITIGNGVTGIEQRAFADCVSLTGITIPDSVKSIGSQAFSNCAGLFSVTIGKNVKSIGSFAFSGCTSLAAINTAAGNSAYTAENGILYNKNKTSLIVYPAGKKDISFSMPDSVKKIERSAFEDCTSLISVVIPNSVADIGPDAFSNCSGLTSVIFQGTITSKKFDIYAFPGNLRSVFYAANKANGTPGTYTRIDGESETWNSL